MTFCGATLLLLALAPPPTENADCLACHGEAGARSDAGQSVFVDAATHAASAHGALGCTACHEGMTAEYPHPAPAARPACASCHTDAESELQTSVHGRLHGAGPDAPACSSCHGPVHAIPPLADERSPVARSRLPDTCGSCHSDPEFLARHKVPFARPVEAYKLSIHGRALARGERGAASCSDCHGIHAIRAARDAESRINHWRVPETCGGCHAQVRETFATSVHGAAVARGVRDAPVCTDCHGEHTILAPSEPESLVNPARVSSVTCARCHADERLAGRYSLPRDRVPAFQESFHGLALRAGSQTVANCASCHGVHNILPSSDPRSTVHPANLARTCGSCHPGAGERFAIGPVHVRPATASEHVVVRLIRWAYLLLIPLTVGFMLLHNGLDFLAKLVRGGVRHGGGGGEVPRMNLKFRVAHGLVVLSFPLLVVTGFALKYPEAVWAAPLLVWESDFAFRGWLHRAAGVVLLLALVYHGIHLATSARDRSILRAMLPGGQDLRDLVALTRYNLGRAKQRPTFGKFSYAEKLEYWAFMWGSVVMALSGFLLWFNDLTLRHFPTWVADAATAIHWYEAILATLSILIWHFYMVIFDPDVYPMEKAWITGRMSAEHLRRTRPEYYQSLASEAAPAAPAERARDASGARPEKPIGGAGSEGEDG
jgi:formate dehydrogenase gamma subunit